MQLPATQAMFATSSKGLHAFSLTGQVTSIGLSDTVVSQATARDETLLAAVPVIHAVHKMMSYVEGDSREQQSGLFMFDLSKGVRPEMKGKQVYNGNVKSCAIGKQSTSGKQRWYAGTEPADVLISEDTGATWADTSSFQAIPSREKWLVQSQLCNTCPCLCPESKSAERHAGACTLQCCRPTQTEGQQTHRC